MQNTSQTVNATVETTRIASDADARALALTAQAEMTFNVNGETVTIEDDLFTAEPTDKAQARAVRAERAYTAVNSTVGRMILHRRTVDVHKLLQMRSNDRSAHAIGASANLMAMLQSGASNEMVAGMLARLLRLMPATVGGDTLASQTLTAYKAYYKGAQTVRTNDWRQFVTADYQTRVDKARTERQRAISAAHVDAVNRLDGLLTLAPSLD